MIVWRVGPFSRATERRSLAAAVAVVAVVLAVSTWSLTTGDGSVSASAVVRALTGTADADTWFVVGTLRLPRLLVAVAAGASLGLSGALFQALVHNPLASPDVIGFTGGAAAGAVLAITVAGVTSTAGVATGALAGGLVAAALVIVPAGRERLDPRALVLGGIGVALATRALVDLLLTRVGAEQAQRSMVWLVGSLSGRTWADVRIAAGGLVVFGCAAALVVPALRSLQHGDDLAVGWGRRLGPARLAVVTAGIGLAASATAAAGPIGFVALLAPPIARRLGGGDGAALGVSALVGAALTAGADVVGREVVPGIDLPVGITTSLLGGPYLAALLLRGRGVGS